MEIYDEHLTADAFSRRDYGYFRALAGIAVASAGRPDDAAAIGRESLGIAAATGSMRTLTELSRLADRLGSWPGRPAVRVFRAELAVGPQPGSVSHVRDRADHGCLPLLRLRIPVQRVVMHREAVLRAVDFDEPGFGLGDLADRRP